MFYVFFLLLLVILFRIGVEI